MPRCRKRKEIGLIRIAITDDDSVSVEKLKFVEQFITSPVRTSFRYGVSLYSRGGRL